MPDPTRPVHPIHDEPAMAKKRKEGSQAMVMEKFSLRVDEEGRKGTGPGAGSPERDEGTMNGSEKSTEGPAELSALPLFLDAREGGRRLMLGLFPDEDSALLANERINREAGPGTQLRLMSIQKLEVLKELDFGPVLQKTLELD